MKGFARRMPRRLYIPFKRTSPNRTQTLESRRGLDSPWRESTKKSATSLITPPSYDHQVTWPCVSQLSRRVDTILTAPLDNQLTGVHPGTGIREFARPLSRGPIRGGEWTWVGVTWWMKCASSTEWTAAQRDCMTSKFESVSSHSVPRERSAGPERRTRAPDPSACRSCGLNLILRPLVPREQFGERRQLQSAVRRPPQHGVQRRQVVPLPSCDERTLREHPDPGSQQDADFM